MTTFSVDPHKLEELLNYCLGFAKKMLEAHGEFYPFGAVLVPNGTVTAVGAHVGDEHPTGAEVFRFLHSALHSQFQNKEIVAAAIATNVNIPPQYQPAFPDGIRVQLECRGYSRYVYLPYRVSAGRPEYGEFIPVDVPASICV